MLLSVRFLFAFSLSVLSVCFLPLRFSPCGLWCVFSLSVVRMHVFTAWFCGLMPLAPHALSAMHCESYALEPIGCYPYIQCLVFWRRIAVNLGFLRGKVGLVPLCVQIGLRSLATEPNCLQLIDKSPLMGRLVEMVYHTCDRMFLGLCGHDVKFLIIAMTRGAFVFVASIK